MRVLLLSADQRHDAAARLFAAHAQSVVLMCLERRLGGVWNDHEGGVEIVRVGYPADSKHPFFQPLAPRPGTPTCLSVVLGRVVFTWRLHEIIVLEAALEPVVRHGLAGHDVRCWWSAEPAPPAKFHARGAAAPIESLIEAITRRTARSAA